jgi:hypothetical protein
VVVTLYRHQKHFYVRDKRIGIVLAAWAGYQLLTDSSHPSSTLRTPGRDSRRRAGGDGAGHETGR